MKNDWFLVVKFSLGQKFIKFSSTQHWKFATHPPKHTYFLNSNQKKVQSCIFAVSWKRKQKVKWKLNEISIQYTIKMNGILSICSNWINFWLEIEKKMQKSDFKWKMTKNKNLVLHFFNEFGLILFSYTMCINELKPKM